MDFNALLERELAHTASCGLRRDLGGPLPAHVVNYSSNDYLGLSTHPALLTAAQHALQQATGAGAARLVGGDRAEHHALEAALAHFKGTEAALLFGSGYQANVGAISALVGPDDAVYSDALNHASIIDGCRLSGAAIHVYRHADPQHLAELLSAGAGYRRRLVITESVFSMDGDQAPLVALAQLARVHDAALMVDEAHASGLYGPSGAGLLRATGVCAEVQLVTLGKALGGFGGAVLGRRALIDLLINRARTFIFTTALPPVVCTNALAALRLAAGPLGDQLRLQLFVNAAQLHRGLVALGLRSPATPPSPILPLLAGTPERSVTATRALLDRGCFVQAIRPPTVPQGTSRLRLTASAAHTPEQLDTLLAALADLVRADLLPTLSPR
jgi:8-amino-7-oxononanoate synthase